MSAAAEAISISGELLEEANRQAERLGVTTQEWVKLALTERIRLEQNTAAYFRERAARVSGRSLSEILAKAGNNPPDPGDELPEDWSREEFERALSEAKR